MEPELLHTYSRIDPYDTLILCVRLAVLTAVTLTVPIVLFPVSLLICSPVMLNEQRYLVGSCVHVCVCMSTGPKSHSAHVVPHQGFPLAATHRHRCHPAHLHQHAGDICS